VDTPIERLHAALLTLSGDRKNFPRTRKLLESGKTRIAQKLGEEAIEVALETVKGDRARRRPGERRSSLSARGAMDRHGDLAGGSLGRDGPAGKNLGLAEKLPKVTARTAPRLTADRRRQNTVPPKGARAMRCCSWKTMTGWLSSWSRG